MLMQNRYLIVALICLLPCCLLAQRDQGGRFAEGFYWGFKGGITADGDNEIDVVVF